MADQDDITNATSAQLPEGFKVVGGRKFANNIKYLLPNDDDERDRLTQQHYVVRQLIHGNFNAPVEDFLEQGIRVLDAGCGNGLWLLDMAQDYPRSIFVGTDASAEGFPTSDVPPNCTFILADTLQGLPFQDSTFDYVFQRFMNGAFSPADWASAVKEFTRVAKSGAYLELFELSLQYKRTPPGPPRLRDATITFAKSRGIDLNLADHLEDLLRTNDFTDIEIDYISMPLGWGGGVGERHARNVYHVWTSVRPMLECTLGIDTQEFWKLMNETFENYRECRTWHKANYAFGRKPLASVREDQ